MNTDQVIYNFVQDEEDTYRDQIATVDKEGKRVWLYPKKPKGPFYDKRKLVSYLLLLILFGMPFIKVGGKPLLMFNILKREFILFGIHFMPQDFHLFVIAMLISIVFIALFTVVFGRLFCGWVCPQTIFMEMVYRRIEYWIEGDANAQRRLDKAPWTTDKILKKGGKQILFFLIAVLVANTFLAYIISMDEVIQIATEPISQNLVGFIAMILFSFAFYFVFSFMREQVCVAICPYGRMQGVLLDDKSIAIYYDYERGEPRGKIKKNRKPKPAPKPANTCGEGCSNCNSAAAVSPTDKALTAIGTNAAELTQIQQPKLGDCIDCGLCVKVCPTGIDIRDGLQLECVNCTACIDACDEVMEKINRPKGLIRYTSLEGITKKETKIFNTRVMAYSVVLVVLILVEAFLFMGRNDVEALLLRTPGMLYQKTEEGLISNLYNYQITNKTDEPLHIEFVLEKDGSQIRFVGEPPVVDPTGQAEGAVFIDLPRSELDGRKTKLTLQVVSDGKVVDDVSTTFLGPM